MTIRYTKYKDGVKHNFWLCNISNIEIVYSSYTGGRIPVGLDITIKVGFVFEEYLKEGVTHTTKTTIDSPQHFIIRDSDTRKHLHLYL